MFQGVKKGYIGNEWVKIIPPRKPISAQCCLSFKNQSFNLQGNSNDWFPYEMQHWVEMCLEFTPYKL